MHQDGHLHAIKALTVPTYEVISLGLVEQDEVFTAGPVAGRTIRGAVVVTCLVHLEHVVLVLLVPECCGKETTPQEKRRHFQFYLACKVGNF